MRGGRFTGALIASLFLATSCTISFGPPPAHLEPGPKISEDSIVVASFDFDESRVLAELYATVLEEHDYPVHRFMNLGSREFVQPALQQGRVDLVPEYAGSAFEFLTFNGEQGATGSTLRSRLASLLAPRGVKVLSFARAQDKNAIVVTQGTAIDLGLEEVSDLTDYAPGMTLGGPPECPERPLCLIGLTDLYSLEFRNFLPLDPGGPTVAALTADEIDAGVLFSTDPSILAYNLVLLRDDRGLQPRENVVPVLRAEVVERYGKDLTDLLDSVSDKLTTVSLRSLNRQVALGGDPYEVALGWLRTEGLVR